MDRIVNVLDEINNSLININKSLNKPKKVDYGKIILWIIIGIFTIFVLLFVYNILSPYFDLWI